MLLFLVGAQHSFFQLFAQAGADRMDNVAIFSVRHTARGHRQEQAVLPVDDLDIVHGKYVVKRD